MAERGVERRCGPLPGARRPRAFTLIELLVVVAIISLLIAVLLPSLRGAREQARRSECLTNLRSLAAAWHAYLPENRSRFLQYPNADFNYGGWQGTNPLLPWVYAGPPLRKPLNRYVGLDESVLRSEPGVQVYRCPSDGGSEDRPQGQPTYFEYYGTSYTTNQMLIGATAVAAPPTDPVRPVLLRVNARLPNLRFERVDTPHPEMLLMGDGGWEDTLLTSQWRRTEWHAKRGTHCLSFLDGHAAFVRIRKGLRVTTAYVQIPFRDLALDAAALQVEVFDE